MDCNIESQKPERQHSLCDIFSNYNSMKVMIKETFFAFHLNAFCDDSLQIESHRCSALPSGKTDSWTKVFR